MGPSICSGKQDKLLVCTDGSDESKAALSEALSLAKACGSQVYLFQVVAIVPEFEAAAPDLMARAAEEVRAHMEDLKVEAAKMGMALETRVARSVSAFSAILEEADRIQPDMIVMGRHGLTGLQRLLLGSVAARVIGHSPFNVLIVPQGAMISFAHILVASDGSRFSNAAVATALELARQHESKLYGVSVATEEGEIPQSQEIIQRLMAAANQAGVPFQGTVPQGRPADDGIVQAAIKNEVDLIVMGSHGRTGLKRLLMGSVTERVIGQSPCPVLVVKKKAE